MNQIEAAFFYGDFTSLRTEISEMLYENIPGTDVHDRKSDLEVTTQSQYNIGIDREKSKRTYND